VQKIAADNNGQSVTLIKLRIGGLSGVEPPLLERAFEIARAGTIAAQAELKIEAGPVVVKCRECGASSAVTVNRLLCQYCGDWRVTVRAGDVFLFVCY
jgi:hydrogenase nickel incorporation protein HypA/HybF